jgi:hypothetical protein
VILDPVMSSMMLEDIGIGTRIDGRIVRDVLIREMLTSGELKPAIGKVRFT